MDRPETPIESPEEPQGDPDDDLSFTENMNKNFLSDFGAAFMTITRSNNEKEGKRAIAIIALVIIAAAAIFDDALNTQKAMFWEGELRQVMVCDHMFKSSSAMMSAPAESLKNFEALKGKYCTENYTKVLAEKLQLLRIEGIDAT